MIIVTKESCKMFADEAQDAIDCLQEKSVSKVVLSFNEINLDVNLTSTVSGLWAEYNKKHTDRA
jgi:hypothetical protein